MILSMTGFGRASIDMPTKKINVEIKSVNSKTLDISFRMNGRYREKELELRQLLSKQLERGKVDFNISVEHNSITAPLSINQELAMYYYKELKMLNDMIHTNHEAAEQIPNIVDNNCFTTMISGSIHTSSTDYLGMILKMPDVMKGDSSELDPEEWTAIKQCVDNAILDCIQFRKDEGEELKNEFIKRIELILSYLKEVELFEPQRLSRIRERIHNNINELFPNVKVDESRLEQEMVFYVEKLDITEEKVRLRKHCSYFIETLNSSENTGKKLNFICQEIGREINTLGSKSNDYEMQKLVVMMKDELEKIKEQILNIL